MRLKLYLSTVLLAGSTHGHTTYGANVVYNVSAASWARALALPDPETKGARRVADAQSSLRTAKLLQVKRRPGSEPIVRLRSADGRGRAWSRPTAPYITVPLELWQNHWIWTLSGKELAVLIALIDFLGGRGEDGHPDPQWLSTEQRDSYGFSDDTWRLATAALEEKKLLEIRRNQSVQFDFETPRRRNTYWLDLARLDDDAVEAVAHDDAERPD